MTSLSSACSPSRLRAPLLLPGESPDSAIYHPDGAVITNEVGIVEYVGSFSARPNGLTEGSFTRTGLLIPPLLDCHIHIPQNPIKGRFVEGVIGTEIGGALLAGLNRNVFPAEARCVDPAYAEATVRQFLADTRAAGTLGGVAYMTCHPVATRIALELLPASWRVGLVLMDFNCPPDVRISPEEALPAMEGLARDFGDRFVVTDRFAVSCSTPLRAAAVDVARRFGLTTQTHLAEQPGEVQAVRRIYPEARDYTGVYESEGLLTAGRGCIAAHCIYLSPREWERLAATGTRIAHCPVSNTELGSGVMPLDTVYQYGIQWCLCTDVGASPTTSLLTEMTHFLGVHQSRHASPTTAFWRATEGARRLGELKVGDLRAGSKLAAVEIASDNRLPPASAGEITADAAICAALLGPAGAAVPDIARALASRVVRVWEAG